MELESRVDYEIKEYEKIMQEIDQVIYHLFDFNNQTQYIHKDELLEVIDYLQKSILIIEKNKNSLNRVL